MTDHDAPEIDRQLRALHGSTSFAKLKALHRCAAQISTSAGAQRFHLTHAWVFALVDGDEREIEALESELRERGGL